MGRSGSHPPPGPARDWLLEPGLSLVPGPDIAEIRLSETVSVDMFEYQRQVANSGAGHTDRDAVTGFQRTFHCRLCALRLTGPDNVRKHCQGKEHEKKVVEFQRKVRVILK